MPILMKLSNLAIWNNFFVFFKVKHIVLLFYEIMIFWIFNNNNNLFLEQTNKINVYIFTLFVYTHTEPREHQKAVLPRHVVPHEAEN